MNKIKMFYKQTSFYLSILALALAVTALFFYALNCASEFNGGAVSQEVVTADILAVVFLVIAIGATIAKSFLADKPLIMDILSYRRFFLYFAFVALIYSFCMSILAEYSLIGTILYPIVSGTVGDPVDPVLSSSYFIKLIGTLFAVIMTLTVALIQKKGYYKQDKAKDHPSVDTEAMGE
ncbi:MAG: hypothetical protein RBQ86_07275 [Candidatus Izemoplasmatales bacterium]|nr:hypothetical protein [Candidatus Izemoplasmatales bacterium]